jgi:hypothetical protein
MAFLMLRLQHKMETSLSKPARRIELEMLVVVANTVANFLTYISDA